MPSVNHHAMITGKSIVDETVLRIDIGPDAIGSSELAPGAVAYGTQLVNDVIGSQHVANNAISYPAQIKDGIIGYSEITTGLQGSLASAPDSVGTTQLKEPAVGSENIYNGAVYGTKIADNAVGFSKLTTGVQGSLGGMPDSIGTTELMEPAVGSQNIYTGAVYGVKIADNAVGYSKLSAGLQGSLGGMPDTIGTTQLKEPGVGSENLYTGAVYGPKIADHTIGSHNLIVGSVIIQSEDQLGNAVINEDKIQTGGVKVFNLGYPYDFGTIDVTATGAYREYALRGTGSALTFIEPPTVVLTPIGTIGAYLDHTPDIGSFMAKLESAGTETVHYIAIGAQ